MFFWSIEYFHDFQHVLIRSVPHEGWLVHFPSSHLWKFVVVVRNDHAPVVVINIEVANVFVGPFVLEGPELRLETERTAGALGHFAEEGEHYPNSSVEVSNWELSQQKVAHSVPQSESMESPVPICSVVPLSTVMFLDKLNLVASDP